MYVFHLRRSHLRILLLYIHMLRWRYRHRLIACRAPLLCAVCPFSVSSLFQRLFNRRRNDLEGQGGGGEEWVRLMDPDSGSWRIFDFEFTSPTKCCRPHSIIVWQLSLIVFSSAPCHMIDTWRQRKTRKKGQQEKNNQTTLAVIILHALWIHMYCDTTTKRPVHSSPPSTHLPLNWTHLPLHPYRLCQQNIILKQKRTWAPNTFIMVNKAIPVNGNHVVNGAVSDIAITSHGSSWYFVRWHVISFPASNVRIASLTEGWIGRFCCYVRLNIRHSRSVLHQASYASRFPLYHSCHHTGRRDRVLFNGFRSGTDTYRGPISAQQLQSAWRESRDLLCSLYWLVNDEPSFWPSEQCTDLILGSSLLLYYSSICCWPPACHGPRFCSPSWSMRWWSSLVSLVRWCTPATR